MGLPPVTKKNILDLKLRRKMYNHIKYRPGVTLAEIANKFDKSKGNAHYHIALLLRFGRVKYLMAGVYKKYYVADFEGPKYNDVNPTELKVLRAYEHGRDLYQNQVVEMTGIPQATVSRTTRSLYKRGLLIRNDIGSFRTYRRVPRKRSQE